MGLHTGFGGDIFAERKTPHEGANYGIGMTFSGVTESMSVFYHLLISPCQESYRQPDTLMSLCGRNGPAYQETKLELLAKDGATPRTARLPYWNEGNGAT